METAVILTPESLKRVTDLRDFMQEATDFLDGVAEEKREATWLLEKAIFEFQKQTWDLFIVPALKQETFYDKTTALLGHVNAMMTATEMVKVLSLVGGKQTIAQGFKTQITNCVLNAVIGVLMDEGIVTEENLKEMVKHQPHNSEEINRKVADLMKGM